MSTWVDLIADVRAQIDVTDDQAYVWLLERARVMNAEASWLLTEVSIPAITGGANGEWEYQLPDDIVRTEALIINGVPFRRATLAQMDDARACSSIQPIYSDAVDPVLKSQMLAIWPPPDGTAVEIILRYLRDVADDRTGAPPFPNDLHSAIADGAIATGLARMDERFDSAGYFEARFTDATSRLKARRHSRAGRGGTRIRVVT
jgi:hypothetical protein